MVMQAIAAAVFVAGVSAAAASDVLSRRVSNRLNLAILLAGLAWRLAQLDGLGVLAGFAGVLVGLLMLIVPFAVRWIGAGDVKLLAAMGMWLGPAATGLTGLFGIAGGGVLAAVIGLSAGAQVRREVASNVYASIMTLTAPAAPQRARHHWVPLAVPLAGAGIGVFLATGLV